MGSHKRRYTKEELKDFLVDIGLKLNKVPSQPSLKKHGAPSPNTFVNAFGSWSNALNYAGFDNLKYTRKNFTREYLIEYLQKISTKSNMLTVKDLNVSVDQSLPNSHSYVKEFGSFTNALVAANIIDPDYYDYRLEYSDKDLLSFLSKYMNEFGENPSMERLESKKGYPNGFVFIHRFGSFNTALERVNLKVNKKFNLKCTTKKDALRLLKEYIVKNNKLPTGDEIDESECLPGYYLYVKWFGGINSAFEQLGYEPNYALNKYKTETELLNELYDLFIRIGRVPSINDICDDHICSSYSVYYDRFRDYYSMLEKANISYNRQGSQLSDEEVFKKWNQAKEKYNHYPTRTELMEFGIQSVISKRWGNYKNFLLANNIEINKDTYGYRIYYTTNNTVCLSKYELMITEWLERNKIDFKKEVRYSSVIPNDETLRRFDWVINANNKVYYVEMFGIEKNRKYNIKIKDKIETCIANGINLIELYPDDLKRPLDEVFSFLFELESVV